MPFIAVDIVRFVDDAQPGFVECRMTDAAGVSHRFVEKVPVVSTAPLTRQSAYPQSECVAVEVEAAWADDHGRGLMRVNTRPWGVASVDGSETFVVEQSSVVADR